MSSTKASHLPIILSKTITHSLKKNSIINPEKIKEISTVLTKIYALNNNVLNLFYLLEKAETIVEKIIAWCAQIYIKKQVDEKDTYKELCTDIKISDDYKGVYEIVLRLGGKSFYENLLNESRTYVRSSDKTNFTKINDAIDYIIYHAVKSIICEGYIQEKGYSKSNKNCETASIDKQVIEKLDYALEYIKNNYVRELVEDRRSSLYKIVIQTIPIIYIVVLNIMARQNNSINQPILLYVPEVINFINKIKHNIYFANYPVKDIIESLNPSCDGFDMPILLNAFNINDASMFYRMSLKYENSQGKDDLLVVIPKVKCVFYDVFMIVMYKIKKIFDNYKEFQKKYPETDDTTTLRELVDFLKVGDIYDMVFNLTNCGISYDDYCRISRLKLNIINSA